MNSYDVDKTGLSGIIPLSEMDWDLIWSEVELDGIELN